MLPNGTINTIGSGFSLPYGVAVDAAGDVFVADYGSTAVKEVLPNGTINTIGSGFSEPQGVAVDAAGDVFVAELFSTPVVELSPPTVAATPSPLTGTTATAISATLTGLTPDTTYYFRAVAASAGGTVAASASSFTTTTTTVPTFTDLTSATITYGTATVTLSGTLADGPAGGSVTVTVSGNGITPVAAMATTQPDGLLGNARHRHATGRPVEPLRRHLRLHRDRRLCRRQ